jgi:hypothetical protein
MGRIRRRLAAIVCASGLIAGIVWIAPHVDATPDGPYTYGVDPFGNSASEKGLRPFDAATGANGVGFVITNIGGPVTGAIVSAHALAHDPSPSGKDYAILKVQGHATRVLATIDLSNGDATTIADTLLQITGITFATDGTLYAVTSCGDGSGGSSCTPSLYQLDKTGSSAPTFLTNVSNPDNCCGQAIAYNPNDDEIYHATGFADATTPATFEKIDRTSPFTVTNIGYSREQPDQATGMGFDASSGRFIMTDIDSQVWSVTPDGLTTLLAATNQTMRGLIVTNQTVPANSPPTAVDDNLVTVRGGAGSRFSKVLANDSDPEDDPMTIESFTQPPHGFVNDAGLGRLAYQPQPGYCNDAITTDDFTYTLNGGSTATVRVTVECQHLTVYGVSPYGNGNQLQPFDRAIGALFGDMALVVVGGPVAGNVSEGHGLAVNPIGGQAFGVFQIGPGGTDVLAKVDLSNGHVRTIANTKQTFAGITFGSDGTLYGLTASVSGCVTCLYKLNTRTGAKTFLTTLPDAHCCGEAIGFDPVDGMLYHTNGTDTQPLFEKVDPHAPFTVTNVGYTGTAPNEVEGIGFDQESGSFVMLDGDAEIWSVTPAGSTMMIAHADAIFRGLVVGTWRKVTLKYSATHHLFTGALSAGEPGCIDGRTVSIFKKTSSGGIDLDDAVTASDGSFFFSDNASKGKYYATVNAETLPQSNCAAARSKPLAIS